MKRFEHLIIDPCLAARYQGLWLTTEKKDRSLPIAENVHVSLRGLMYCEEWQPELKSYGTRRDVLKRLAERLPTLTPARPLEGIFLCPNDTRIFLYTGQNTEDAVTSTAPKDLSQRANNVITLYDYILDSNPSRIRELKKEHNEDNDDDPFAKLIWALGRLGRDKITILTDDPATIVFCHCWNYPVTTYEDVLKFQSEGFTDD